jgi:hypothetical protein
MIVIERTVDISKPIQTETLRGNEFKLEANAHTFRISVANNGAAVALTGSVSASMLLADGSGLTLGGSLDNGVAVLTLPQAAYGVPGRFMLAIYSVQTGATEAETVKTCIYACVGAVVNTYGEQQYDPGNLIPDAETLAAYIEACQTATAAANTAAGRAETAALTAVTYAEQTGKTDAEKAQARTNIGAASEAVETAMADHFPATGKLVAGISTTASANGAVATGVSTTASGRASHAEGQLTTADGQVAHAEGYGTTASGDYSHAEGFGTKASGDHQHAFGKYNVEDTNDTYLELAGNGTGDNARSNARTLDWNGNETLAGDLTVNKGGAGEMVLGQEVSSLKSALNQVYLPSANIYNRNADRHGITIDGNGVISENAAYKASDYIYVGAGGKVTIDAISGIYRFFYYTTNDASGFSRALWKTEAGAKTLELRPTEQYIVILMKEECPDYMVNLGTTLLPYAPYGGSAGTFLDGVIDGIHNETSAKADLNDVEKNTRDIANLTDDFDSFEDSIGFIIPKIDGWIPNKYVSRDDGTEIYSATYHATDFIKINPKLGNIILTSSNAGNYDTNYNVWYDVNKNFISNFSYKKNDSKVITPPANARYFRLSSNSTVILTLTTTYSDKSLVDLMPNINADNYIIDSALHKSNVAVTQLSGRLTYSQSFCILDGKYYSTNGTNISEQDADFVELRNTVINVGHGNALQLGHNGKAYASGWNDNKVYVVDLATLTVENTIILPTTGYTTCAIDDLNNIAYIFQRDTYPDNEASYNFIAYDYADGQTLYTRKTTPFAAMQACDIYNDSIIVVNGLGNISAPNYCKVFDINGVVTAQYILPDIMRTGEPEGVFFDRSTCDIYMSKESRNIYKISH